MDRSVKAEKFARLSIIINQLAPDNELLIGLFLSVINFFDKKEQASILRNHTGSNIS
jgi:hypothetical protein